MYVLSPAAGFRCTAPTTRARAPVHACRPQHCDAHKDRGLLTIALDPEGLEALSEGGEWVRMDLGEGGRPLDEGCAVVFAGLTLEAATAGLFRATTHRVANRGARTSLVAKIRAASDAVLDVRWSTRRVHAGGGALAATAGAAESVSVSALLARHRHVDPNSPSLDCIQFASMCPGVFRLC